MDNTKCWTCGYCGHLNVCSLQEFYNEEQTCNSCSSLFQPIKNHVVELWGKIRKLQDRLTELEKDKGLDE